MASGVVVNDPRYLQQHNDQWARFRAAQDAEVRRNTDLARETGAYWNETRPGGASIFRSGATTGTGGSGTSAGGGTGTGTVDFSAALNAIPKAPTGGGADPTDAEDPRQVALSYARAKDRAGLEAQGAAKSIRSLMARRGLSGSNFAAAQEGGAVRTALGRLGEYNEAEAAQGAQRRGQVADRNYAGGITRRGQDIEANSQRVQQALSLAALQARNAEKAY